MIITCFHKGPMVLHYALVMWTLYFSQFFTSFCIRFTQNFFSTKVPNVFFIICSLLVGIDFVSDKSKVSRKLHFFEWKNALFRFKFSPQNTENRILGLWKFKIFWGSLPPETPLPPQKRGPMAPCWYSRLLYSNLLATSIIIETPVV